MKLFSATKKFFSFLSSSFFSIFNTHKGNRYEHSERREKKSRKNENENEDESEMEIELGFMMILIFNL